jgi:hypothetical protein
MTTTASGNVAVGADDGQIRLYDSISKVAKTCLPGLGGQLRSRELGDTPRTSESLMCVAARFSLCCSSLIFRSLSSRIRCYRRSGRDRRRFVHSRHDETLLAGDPDLRRRSGEVRLSTVDHQQGRSARQAPTRPDRHGELPDQGARIHTGTLQHVSHTLAHSGRTRTALHSRTTKKGAHSSHSVDVLQQGRGTGGVYFDIDRYVATHSHRTLVHRVDSFRCVCSRVALVPPACHVQIPGDFLVTWNFTAIKQGRRFHYKSVSLRCFQDAMSSRRHRARAH